MSALKVIFNVIWISVSVLVAITSLFLFWQDQVPIVTYRIDQTHKTVAITNHSVIPISFSMYAVQYNLDEADGRIATTAIESWSDLGFVQTSTIVWPYVPRTISLGSNPFIQTLPWTATSGLEAPQIYYCLAMKAENLLSNQVSSYTDFTWQYDFPLSGFGQNPVNSSAGGGYESEQRLMTLRNQMVNSCDYEAEQYQQ